MCPLNSLKFLKKVFTNLLDISSEGTFMFNDKLPCPSFANVFLSLLESTEVMNSNNIPGFMFAR